MVEVSEARFEALVADALDAIPEELGHLMDNVAIVVRDGRAHSGLLGYYEGVPLTERGGGYDGMVLPDRITIYRLPIVSRCANEAEVVEQVQITVVHEVAHHFGIDDERLTELGWA
ncbi:MAG: metallopeptidase family protein [Acidimicrobiia bacterium]|nr:metallopeptidase family protein [Acidimicrobiia bacterium]